MNGNVRRNAKTAFVCVLFIIIVSLFFYLLTAGTMPKYVDIPSADKIADDKIVQTHGERHNSAGHDAGGDLMERHLEKRLQPKSMAASRRELSVCLSFGMTFRIT